MMKKYNGSFALIQNQEIYFNVGLFSQLMESEAVAKNSILKRNFRKYILTARISLLMTNNKLILSDYWVNYLVNLPENGMGYQLVKIILKSGKVFSKHKIINSSILVLEDNENFEVNDIEKIELEK